MVFGAACAAIYGVMAFVEPTYAALLIGVFVLTAVMQFVAGAAAGLSSAVGRHHAMSGQMSTVMNAATLSHRRSATAMARQGGVLSGLLEGAGATTAARILFLLGGGLMLAMTAFGALGPGICSKTPTPEAWRRADQASEQLAADSPSPCYCAPGRSIRRC